MIKPPSILSLLILFMFSPMATWSQYPEKKVEHLYNHINQLNVDHYDSMIIYANEIYRLSDSTKYQKGLVLAELASARVFINLMKIDTALELIASSRARINEHSDLRRDKVNPWTYNYMAESKLRKFALEESEAYCDSALSLINKYNHNIPLFEAQIQHIKGRLDNLNENFAAALGHFLNAYTIQENNNVPKIRMRSVLTSISDIYGLLGQQEKALKYSRINLRTYEETSYDTKGFASTLVQVAKHHYTLNNLDSSEYYYQKAIYLSDNQKLSFIKVRSSLGMALILSSKKQFYKSIQMLDSIQQDPTNISLFTSLDFNYSKAFNYFHLNQFDSAKLYSHKGIAIANKMASKQRFMELSGILADIHYQENRIDSAYFHRTNHFKAKNDLTSQQSQRTLSNLYAEIESLEKEREIVKLEKEKQLQTANQKILQTMSIGGAAITILIIISLVLSYRNKVKRHQLESYELEAELKERIKDLSEQSLKLINKDKNLTEIEDGLKVLKKSLINGEKREVQSMLNTIKVNSALDKEWQRFDEYFGRANEEFFEQLTKSHPALTLSEKRLASLIRMNVSHREIANITKVANKSVSMAKYRLKKKLGLKESDSLDNYLINY